MTLLLSSFFFSSLFLTSLSFGSTQKEIHELPLVSKIWIGSENGLITSNRLEEFRSPNDVQIKISIKNKQWLEKGEHWATISPENLELEKKSLELARKKTAHEISQLQDKKYELLITLQTKLQELGENKHKLKILSEQGDLPKKTLKLIQFALSEIDTQEIRAREKLQPKELNTLTSLKEKELLLNLEKKEKSLRDLLQASELKAKFSGRLTLHLDSDQLNDIDLGKNIWLKNNTLFASLIDDRQYNVELKPLAQNLYAASPNNTTLLLGPLESGHMVRADFERFEPSKSSPNIKKWIFSIHPDDIQYAPSSIGLVRIAHLYKKFDKPYHIVLKKNIASVAPEILKNQGWRGLVKHLWPQANIIFIGPQAIALTENEN